MREYRDELPIEQVHGHPHNVRQDLGDLTELVASIREIGILEPLVVAPAEDGNGYVAIAGNRRRAASVLAGLRVVPAIIRTGLSEQQVYQAMLVENLHRVGLTPMEEAKALKGLKDSGLTLMEIAQKIGKSDAFVHDRIILNELPDELRQKLINKEIRITAAVKMARVLAGRSLDKVDRGWDLPHFAKGHPLWPLAYSRCQELEHGLRRRIAGVCGSCWEATIRDDQRRNGGAIDVRPVAVGYVPAHDWFTADTGTAHAFGSEARLAMCGMSRDRETPAAPDDRRCQRCIGETAARRLDPQPRYDPPVPWSEQRADVVTRAKDLAELHELAGGTRLTVMTATPRRVREMLDRAFRRLVASVEAQERADSGGRRTLEQAVGDLTDVFTDDTDPEAARATG